MIKFAFVGDISLGEHYFNFGHGPRSLVERGISPFESTTSIFTQMDVVVGNLEGPISDIGYDPQSPHKRVFRGSPKSAKLLKAAGISVVNIANNHFAQHGVAAANDSVQLLLQEGITVIGQKAEPYRIIESQGTTIGLLGASLVKDNTDINQSIYNNPSCAELLDQIKTLKAQCELVVVSIHWGIESNMLPESEQRSLAEKIFNLGANLIIGHHPHTLQPLLRRNNQLCAFSLGNFVFDLAWCPTNTESGILCVTTTKDKIESVTFTKAHILPNGKPEPLDTHMSIPEDSEVLLSQLTTPVGTLFSLKKLLYFFRNFFRGSTSVKYNFIAWKICQKLGF